MAQNIFGYGDIDTMSERDSHHTMMNSVEEMSKRQVREANTLYVGKLKYRRDAVKSHLDDREKRRQEQADGVADRIREMDKWKAVGIRERLTLWNIPPFSRWLLWILIASLDFYIFARAIAYAENIADPNPSDGSFWLGGAYGLLVFIASLFVARAYRRVSYHWAQKRLLRDLQREGADTTGLRVSYPSFGTTAFATVFYAVLSIGAFVVRFQGGGKQSSGLLLMQTLVPLVGVVVELLIDDPTEVRVPEPNIVDWFLAFRLRRLDKKLELREKVITEREGAVTDRFKFERAALDTLHDGAGTPDRQAPP